MERKTIHMDIGENVADRIYKEINIYIFRTGKNPKYLILNSDLLKMLENAYSIFTPNIETAWGVPIITTDKFDFYEMDVV